MMALQARAVLIASCLMLTGILAGCLESGSPSGNEVPPSDGGTSQEPLGPGASGPADPGSGEPQPTSTKAESRVKVDPNATFIGGAHTHDWWGDDTQYIIMDETIPTGPGGVCAGAVTFPCNGGAQFIKFQSSPNAHERPNNVWPGTGTMEIQVKVGQVASSFMLEVAGPGGGFSWAKTRYEIKSANTKITLQLNETNTDPPHFRSSGWTFRLWVGPTGASAFTGPMHMTVTIFKGREPPVDPPHPDYWNGETRKVLVDGARSYANYTRAGVGSGSGYGGGPKIPDNATVTIGAGKMIVTMRWTNTDNTLPAKLGLEYCAATGYCGNTYSTWHSPRPTSDGSNYRVYEIEVRPDEWDSPYEKRTKWGFRWFFEDAAGLGYGTFKGYVEWHIEIFKIES